MSMLIGKVEPGDTIGRCRIIRELGRGGVGTVYLARHQTLQIEVALKVLSPAMSLEQPALAERFIREAQLAARIRHPNVISVMDAAHDEPTGLYYIVLEYVGGGALSWHLRNGPLPDAKAVSIMIGIAQALVVAEENSIVHRDIKPENIMLDARGLAKLADLGLAKHEIDSRTSLTLGGSYMGTPAYMSPEQARDAKAADTRDDIYSLGATFYECLTGEPPFRGDTPYNIMSELLTKPSPRVSERRPDIARSLDLICRKMMAKTRSLRYGDAHALVRDLQHFQSHGDRGLDRLEASNFEHESQLARVEALQHGVHTTPEPLELDPLRRPRRQTPGVMRRPLAPPPRSEGDRAVRAAAWLVALVVVATGLLLYAGHRNATPAAVAPVALAPVPPLEMKKPAEPATAPVPKPAPHPVTPTVADKLVAPRAFPVVLPSAGESDAVAPGPATTFTTNGLTFPLPAGVTPGDMAYASFGQSATPTADLAYASLGIEPPPSVAAPAIAETAFQARTVAEAGLAAALVAPSGRASLLKIIGPRTPGSPSPQTWTYYFYDPSATGNATYRSVRDGRIVRDGEAITVAVFPWHRGDVIAEDKLRIDSGQALAAAQALIPGTPISSSQLELRWPKDSTAPIWLLNLWARNRDGEEVEIGSAQILADTGYVIRKSLHAPES